MVMEMEHGPFGDQSHSIQGLTKPKKEKTGKLFKGTSHAPVEGNLPSSAAVGM